MPVDKTQGRDAFKNLIGRVTKRCGRINMEIGDAINLTIKSFKLKNEKEFLFLA